MRSQKAATSARGLGWCRNKSRPETEQSSAAIETRQSLSARSVRPGGLGRVVRAGPKHWARYGLKSWIEAAKKRLHHSVLAIALANKLARIAWSLLAHGRTFEASKIQAA